MTHTPLPGLELRDHHLPVAVVHGGMGVGISRSGLAIASCGAPNAQAKWYKRPMFALTTGPVSAQVVRARHADPPRSSERAAYGASRPC